MINPLTSYLRCNTCLDSNKTGLKIRDDVFKKDESYFQNKRVKSMISEDVGKFSNINILSRRPSSSQLGPFVLDVLVEFGEEVMKHHLREFDILQKRVVDYRYRDDDLLGPKAAAEAAAQKAATDGYHRLTEDLETVKKHIDDTYQLWVDVLKPNSFSPKSKSPSKGKRKTDGNSEAFRKVARVYVEGPFCPHGGLLIADLNAAKASFAYSRKPEFAMSVAHKDLCAIKARAAGTELPMTREFGETMSIGNSFVRALGFAEREYI